MKQLASLTLAQGYIRRFHPDWVIMRHNRDNWSFAVGPVADVARMEKLGWVRVA